MSPGFWMNLQLRWDLYWTEQAEAKDISKIRRVPSKRLMPT
jgi:plasmid maintenance system antidote protein VapI